MNNEFYKKLFENEKYGNFRDINEVITNDENQKYMIICCNINSYNNNNLFDSHIESTIWKWVDEEYNFWNIITECKYETKYSLSELKEVMNRANEWIDYLLKDSKSKHIELFLIKV